MFPLKIPNHEFNGKWWLHSLIELDTSKSYHLFFLIHSSWYWAIVCLFVCLYSCWGLSPLVSVSHNVSWSPAGLPALPDSWEHSQDSSFSGFCPTHTYYKTPNMKTLEIIHISQKVFVKKYLAETWLNNSNLLGGIILFSTKTHGDHTLQIEMH